MLEYIFKAVLIASFTGTLLALLLMAIKPLTGKCFSPGWNYYIWLIVLFSMIVPVRFNIPEKVNAGEQATFYLPVTESAEITKTTVSPDESALRKGPGKQFIDFAKSHTMLFATIWLSTAFFLLLLRIFLYILFLIRLRKNSRIVSCPELSGFTGRKIATRISNSFSSPLTVGVFKPMIILPETEMTAEQLNNILAHEVIHIKRRDLLYKWFACAVKSIHWFNPALILITKQIDAECEISCDAQVVRNMSEREQSGYIDTIISLIASGSKKTKTVTTGMVGNKKALQRRFTMIKKKIKISRKAVIISAVLAFIIICGTVFATGMLNGRLNDNPETDTKISESGLKEIETDAGKITYNKENGEISSVTSEPKLEKEKHKENAMVKDPELIPDASEKETVSPKAENNTTEKEAKEPVLQKASEDNEITVPVTGEIIRNFGKREHPITKEVHEHNGIDIKAPEGTDVVSSISGTVTDVGFDSEKGNYIVIEKGNIKTLYAQLATTDVKKGDAVAANQAIGTVGKTGNATGAHLHFEVMVDGEYVNPEFKIKAEEESKNADITLSHLTLAPESDIASIEQTLNNSGITISKDSHIDLSKSYIPGKCTDGDSITASGDTNGNITFYFDANVNDYIDIVFSDKQTGAVVAEYGVMPDSAKAYSFMGFEKGKSYNIELQEHIKPDINYLVY